VCLTPCAVAAVLAAASQLLFVTSRFTRLRRDNRLGQVNVGRDLDERPRLWICHTGAGAFVSAAPGFFLGAGGRDWLAIPIEASGRARKDASYVLASIVLADLGLPPVS
jgi:hypothetical protein